VRAHSPSGGRLEFPFSPRVQDWLLGLLLVVATVMAYQPAWHAGFVWDDDVYVTNNHLLSAPDGLKRIWFSTDSPSQYFPLTYTTFWIEHMLWGLNPAGYHCVNIFLHVVNALLVWRLLRRLSVPGAWLAAAIFALHPVEVESVAWITERKNVLSLFFFLLALLSWVEFIEDRAGRWWRFYVPALVFSALALFAKTTACTLPAALFLILWLKKKPVDWIRLAQMVPFLVMGASMGLLTMWWERYHQGTQGKLFSLGLPERILIASHAVWFYAGKLFWPTNLTFSYPRWNISRTDLFAYGWLLAGIGAGMAIYFARRFAGRGVEVGALFFVAILSPLLGFIMLYTFHFTFVADHYQYVASIGLIALAAAGITKVFGFLGKEVRTLKPLFCAALLLTLGVLTWRQCGMYADAQTLWQATLERNPASWMSHNNLGSILLSEGKDDEALEHFHKALEIQPSDNADAHYNLGLFLLRNKEVDEAIVEFRRALEINPNYIKAHDNLGTALAQKGLMDEAISQFRMTLKIQPDNQNAHNNLGLVLLWKGQVDEAVFHFQQALQIAPDYADAHNNLGLAFFQMGRMDEAIGQFQKALEIKPMFAESCNGLGDVAWVLATSPNATVRNGPEAVQLAEEVQGLSGGQNPAIAMTLAAAYAEAGRFSEAIAAAERGLQLANFQNNPTLATALQAQLKFYRTNSPFRDTGTTP
jgi:tetratricopeptide (TPR) repeat protein